MEDIYSDLDNYNDVNAVQELRTENMELKVKLEEHATAMEKLQKEYDTLEMEFKKLENNYSSLLKTARAEIERKTQRIAQLNTEKDLMVLSALQNGKDIRRHFNKSVQNVNKKSNEKPAKEKDTKKPSGDGNKVKNANSRNERCETDNVQVKNIIPCSDIDNKGNIIDKFENAGAKADSSKKKNNTKENMKTEHNDTPKIHVSSIKERRKSMPAASVPVDKFSSDEECEQYYPAKDIRTDIPPIDKFERRNANRIPIDRHSNKTSEASSVDDRGSNYHEPSSRETYRGRASKHTDNALYRGRDKYEVSLRYRKHYSPDRVHRREQRVYHQDDYHRQDHGRYRLESPPPESFHYHQHRNIDTRSNYDRHSHDYEKYRHHYEDKHPLKHKLSNDYDEPYTKRQKTESFSNPDAHFKEDKRYYNDNQAMEMQSIPKFSPHEYDILHTSCQSPDYEQIDAAFVYPVKEIMATAATPLEDPRITSKRYILKKENGKDILSTAVGRNIDIKPVDKTEWNIKPVNIPDALLRRPSQCSEENKIIYMDIDNSASNLSMESGEVCFETDEELGNCNNKERETHKVIQDSINLQPTEGTSKPVKSVENNAKLIFSKYRIPKIGQNKDAQSKMDVPFIDMGENISHKKIVNEQKAKDDNCLKKAKPKQQQNDKHDIIISTNINTKSKSIGQSQVTLSNMAIVADDLELSDENSDNVDSSKGTTTKDVQKKCKVKSDIKVTRKEDSTSNTEKEARNHSYQDNKKDKTVQIKSVNMDEKTKESEIAKKQKSKKKKSKSKEITKDFVERTDAIQITEKKTGSRKEETDPKEIKNKFTDLFGDSSSLMTPEDLGLPSYLPICEDAQDAVDLKINQIIDATPPVMDNQNTPIIVKNRSESKKEEEIKYDSNSENILKTSNTENKEVGKDTKSRKGSKKKEEKIESNEISPINVVDKKCKLEPISSESNVAKTIIISKGVQSQLSLENETEAVVEKPIADVELLTKQNVTNRNHIPAIMEFKKQDSMTALATSTPQKESFAMNSIETVSISDSNIDKAITGNRDSAAQIVEQSNTNTLDTNDAPDVRIFVKRRRKILKRPPMT